jgi:sRNA-binding carbon storage regulator CsrA
MLCREFVKGDRIQIGNITVYIQKGAGKVAIDAPQEMKILHKTAIQLAAEALDKSGPIGQG